MATIYDLSIRTYYGATRQVWPDLPALLTDRWNLIQDAEWVLDFGGGAGGPALEIARRRDVWIDVADVAADALARVPPHPRLATHLLTGESLPFPDARFDVALALHVLHRIARIDGALSQLARVLRPGGRLIVVEFHPRCPLTRWLRLLSHLRRHPCAFFPPGALLALFQTVGLQGSVREIDRFQYAVVGIKEGKTGR